MSGCVDPDVRGMSGHVVAVVVEGVVVTSVRGSGCNNWQEFVLSVWTVQTQKSPVLASRAKIVYVMYHFRWCGTLAGIAIAG